MTLLLPTAGHSTSLINTNDSIPKLEIIKALYKCDSVNTLLSKNLELAAKRDSLQYKQIYYLSNKIVKDRKKKFKSNVKTAVITTTVLVLTKIIFNI